MCDDDKIAWFNERAIKGKYGHVCHTRKIDPETVDPKVYGHFIHIRIKLGDYWGWRTLKSHDNFLADVGNGTLG